MKFGSRFIAVLTVALMLFGNIFMLPQASACNQYDAGMISIHKVDAANGANLSGAIFKIQVKNTNGTWSDITSANGSSSKTITTNASGIATSGWLYAGTYRVIETVAPTGYTLNTTPSGEIRITSADYGKTISLGYNLTNEKTVCKGKVKITKDVIQSYSGSYTFTFKIANQSTGESFTGSVTGETSCTIENVPYGAYTLEEINVPDGFRFNSFRVDGNTVTTITVGACTKDVTCKNDALANIRITKDDGYGHDLSGAKFELFKLNGSTWTSVGAYTSNASGECSITGLPFGAYKVVETSAPFGYADSTSNPGQKVLDVIGETETFAFHNCPKYGSIKIIKAVDKLDDGEPIPSFKVKIVGPSGNDNVQSTTKEYTINKGDNTINDLAYGDYTITEVNIPNGYNKNYTISASSFTINDSHQNDICINIKNTKLYGSAEFKKVVSNVEGDATVFTLRVKKDGALYADVQVSEAGGAVKLENLPFGSYTVEELADNGSYKTESVSPASFEINYNTYAASVKVTATNTLKRGSVKFIKEVSNVTDDAMEFELTIKKDGSFYKTVKVSELKSITWNDLPLGAYTVEETSIPTEYESVELLVNGSKTNVFTVTADNYADTVVVKAVNCKRFGKVKFIKDVNNVTDDATEFELTIKKDGSAYKTIKVSEKISVEWTDLPLGTYTVEETNVPDGYEKVSLTVNGTVNNTFTVTAGNHNTLVVVKATNKKQLAKVTFSKVVTNVADDATEFKINVKKDGVVVGTATVSEIKSDSMYLPLGTYTVEEANATGYKKVSLTVNGAAVNTFEVKADNYTNEVKVQATNEKQFGAVTAKKTITNETNDKAQFTIRITGSGTAAGYTNDIIVTTKGVVSSTKPLNELPLGDYSVQELAAAGYNQVSLTPKTFSITAGNYATPISIEATNEKKLGSVTVIKEINNVTDETAQFTIRITGSGANANYVNDIVVTTKGIVSSTMPLNELPLGTYAVQELAATGYSQISLTPESFTLTADNYKNVVAVTAVNHKLMGSVKFIKDVDNVTDDPTVFTLNVKLDGLVVRTMHVSEMAPIIADDLPFGTYTVEEADADGYTKVSISPMSFTISAGNYTDIIEVKATNHKQLAKVTFTKEVDNVAGDTTSFTLNVKQGGAIVGTVEVSKTVSKVLYLPLGAYTVEEATAAGYEKVSITPGAFTITAGNYTTEVKVHAINHKQLGAVTVKKDVTNVSNDPTTFNVRITGSGAAAGYTSDVVVNEAGVVSSTMPLIGMPLGHYTVEEIYVGFEYIKNGISIQIGSNPAITTGEFDLTAGNYAAAITITASNTKRFGAAEFLKVVDNVSGDATEFTLRVMKDGALYADVKLSEAGGMKKLENLPFGAYTVSEALNGSAYVNTGLAVTVGGVAQATPAFTIDAFNHTAKVAVTATNHRQYNAVTLEKIVDNATGDATKFTLHITNGAGYNHDIELSDADGVVGSADHSFLADLPYGTYTVTETGVPSGYEKVNIKINGTVGNTFTIGESSYGAVVSIVATNHKRLGSAVFTKEVNNVENDATAFTLNVLDKDNEVVGTVTVNETGAAQTLGNLPYGNYTVQEAPNAQYDTVSITPKHFTIDDTSFAAPVAVHAINHKRLGSAVFVKEVDNVENDPTAFTLNVLDEDDKVVGTVTVNETGAAQTIGNLPFGDYTVQEAVATGYETVSITPKLFKIDGNSFNTPVAVKAVNHKKLGWVSFTKSIDNDPEDTTTFTLEITDATGFVRTATIGQGMTGSRISGLPYGHYTIKEVPVDGYKTVSITPEAFDINDTTYAVMTVYSPCLSVSVTNHKLMGRIQITKQDAANPSLFLSGAEFQVSKSGTDFTGDNIKDTLTTDSQGRATSKELPVGVYWVKETKAPGGYVIDDASAVEAAIPADGALKLLVFKDSKDEGSLLIRKLSTLDDKPVEGVQFQVSTRSDFAAGSLLTLPNDGKTDARGELLVEHLETGMVLYVREVKQAPGYDIDAMLVKNVTIVLKQASLVVFKNNPVGTVQLTKVDAADTTKKLAGAVYGIYSDAQCTALVETLAATDGNGLATSSELPFGANTVFYVKEITAPAGYTLSTEIKQAKFTEPGQIMPLTFENSKPYGSLIILKVDALDETKKLAGAVFQLYADEAMKTKVGAEVTTGADGLATWANLEAGAYWIFETAAPKDYDLLGVALPVTVAAGVTQPDPIVIKDQYNPPEDIQTGMMDWNILIFGFLALLAGAFIVFSTRRHKAAAKHMKH